MFTDHRSVRVVTQQTSHLRPELQDQAVRPQFIYTCRRLIDLLCSYLQDLLDQWHVVVLAVVGQLRCLAVCIKIITFNAKSIICTTEFIILNANRYLGQVRHVDGLTKAAGVRICHHWNQHRHVQRELVGARIGSGALNATILRGQGQG